MPYSFALEAAINQGDQLKAAEIFKPYRLPIYLR